MAASATPSLSLAQQAAPSVQPASSTATLTPIEVGIYAPGLGALYEAPPSGPYHERGRLGDPVSWRTPEFLRNAALDHMHAEYAYARGLTGEGVAVGWVDDGVWGAHPELAGANIVSLISKGVYPEDEPRGNIHAGDKFELPGVIGIGPAFIAYEHATSTVASIVGRRDGVGIEGVAPKATMLVGRSHYVKWNESPPEAVALTPNWASIYVATYDQMIVHHARLVNNEWQLDEKPGSTVIDLAKVYAEPAMKPVYDAMGRVDLAGILMVFPVGNRSSEPTAAPALPYFRPDLERNWLTVINQYDGQLTQRSNKCGVTFRYCITAPGTGTTSATFSDQDGKRVPTYRSYGAASMASAHASGAIALVMERFPYLLDWQIKDVVMTTAKHIVDVPGEDLTAPNDRFGWGELDLRSALDGPRQFFRPEQLIVNMPGKGGMVAPSAVETHTCASDACDEDLWANDISGPGGLTKSGPGELTLAGDNTYRGPTQIDEGLLFVSGSITSPVVINRGGKLASNGFTGPIDVAAGGELWPRSMRAHGDVKIDRQGVFALRLGEVAPGAPTSGAINLNVTGAARLEGGVVSVELPPTATLGSYTILTADGGVDGRFDAVALSGSSAKFNASLRYDPKSVELILAPK